MSKRMNFNKHKINTEREQINIYDDFNDKKIEIVKSDILYKENPKKNYSLEKRKSN